MKLKTVFLATVIVLFACFAVCGCAGSPGQQTRMPDGSPVNDTYSTYTSSETGISFTYPTSWGVKENVMGAIVVFIKADGSNINLVIKNMSAFSSSNKTLKEIVDYGVSELKQAFKNVSINETEHTVFKGYDAYNLKYGGDFNGKILQWEQIIFRRGDSVYTLTFTSFTKNTDADAAEARKILDSINIK